MKVRPPDAVLTIGSESFGPVSGLPGASVSLAPGIYQFSLRKEGHRTWRAEVAIRDAMEILEVRLDPE